jgi:hypothetical protein
MPGRIAAHSQSLTACPHPDSTVFPTPKERSSICMPLNHLAYTVKNLVYNYRPSPPMMLRPATALQDADP